MERIEPPGGPRSGDGRGPPPQTTSTWPGCMAPSTTWCWQRAWRELLTRSGSQKIDGTGDRAGPLASAGKLVRGEGMPAGGCSRTRSRTASRRRAAPRMKAAPARGPPPQASARQSGASRGRGGSEYSPRRRVARCEFLGRDRLDIQYAKKGHRVGCRGLVTAIKRISPGQGLISTVGTVAGYRTFMTVWMIAYSDSDSAGCLRNPTSTSGGVSLHL